VERKRERKQKDAEPVKEGERKSARKEKSPREAREPRAPRTPKAPRADRFSAQPEEGMERFRIEVGSEDGGRAANIVGAIANEADIDSEYIGQIAIHDNYSTVDLPFGMPKQILRVLQRARIFNKAMRMSKVQDEDATLEKPDNATAEKGRKQKSNRAPAKKRNAKRTK